MQDPVPILKVVELSIGPKVELTIPLKIPNSSETLSSPIIRLTVELSYGIEVIML